MNSDLPLRAPLSAGLLLALSLFAGCATTDSPKISSNADSNVAYASYRTFAMMPTNVPIVTRSAAITPTLIRDMRKETEAAFAGKGLTRVPQYDADLLVLVHGGLENKIDIQQSGMSYGRLGHRYDIDQYNEGTLLIDVFDARTKELVWRGTAVAQLGNEGPKPELVKSSIDAVVARYPN